MTYAVVVDVPAPIQHFDTAHAEVVRRAGGRVDGLLVHLARPTPTGFQLLEVWETKEQSDRFNADVVGPVLAGMPPGSRPAGEPVATEFEPHGLLVTGTPLRGAAPQATAAS